MPYIVIEGFKDGLDKRRLEQATQPGALTTLKNAHINRGEEIEKRKAFVEKYTLPAGTFGLQALNEDLYVFGSNIDPGVPAGVSYQQLEHEAGAVPGMTSVIGSDVAGNKVFAVAKYDNDDVRPFFDGAVISDFLTGSGTFAEDLVITGPPYAYKKKVYVPAGTNMLFSGAGAYASFDTAAADGSGLIDISGEVTGETVIRGFSAYQNDLAVFSKKNISRWDTDPDPASYVHLQTLPGIGTVAGRSITGYGDHDVFFLSQTGERSIRAINSSLAAGVTDVGTPIDDLLIETMNGLSDTVIEASHSVVEPKDARFMQALDNLIYVFSYFFSSRISSWSVYDPGFTITDFAVIDTRLYARAGNVIYLYGGDDGNQYTTEEVVVEIPYLDGRRLANFKFWEALDFVLEGTWTVSVNVDPNNPSYWVETCVVHKHTLAMDTIGLEQYGPVFKLKFEHTGDADERAKISKIVAHYKETRKT